jgi:hypothetical protein
MTFPYHEVVLLSKPSVAPASRIPHERCEIGKGLRWVARTLLPYRNAVESGRLSPFRVLRWWQIAFCDQLINCPDRFSSDFVIFAMA